MPLPTVGGQKALLSGGHSGNCEVQPSPEQSGEETPQPPAGEDRHTGCEATVQRGPLPPPVIAPEVTKLLIVSSDNFNFCFFFMMKIF